MLVMLSNAVILLCYVLCDIIFYITLRYSLYGFTTFRDHLDNPVLKQSPYHTQSAGVLGQYFLSCALKHIIQ